nr:M24 family metallopeptidase [Rhizobium album]
MAWRLFVGELLSAAYAAAADEVTDVGQQCLIDNLRIGMSGAEINEMCRSAMVAHILNHHSDKPFYLHTSSGIIDATRRAGSSEWCTWNRFMTAKPGMILDSIFDCFLWGYWGNVERTVSVGAPSAEVKRAFDIMIEANEAAFDAIKPGVRMSEIDVLTKKILEKNGYEPSQFGSGMGRGIVSYEGGHRALPLDVRLYNDLEIEPGMAFSIEPMLGVFGLGAFRHCNTVIVTDTGCEVDSRVRRDMIVIEQ